MKTIFYPIVILGVSLVELFNLASLNRLGTSSLALEEELAHV